MAYEGVAPLPLENKFHPDPARAHTIPARYYYDPHIFEREREEIFYKTWQWVGHVEDLAEVGSYVTRRLFDQNVFVIRGEDGKLRAFHNVCMHRARELVEGKGKNKYLVCPYHSWTYDTFGRLRTAPGSEKVEGFNAEEISLKEVQVEEFASLAFVNLDPDAPSLRSLAGPLELELRATVPEYDRLTLASHIDYEIKANWKVIAENFMECYHCPTVHPAFIEVIEHESFRSTLHEYYQKHTSRSKDPDNSGYRFSLGDEIQVGNLWALWPNTMWMVFPGGSNYTIFHIMPTGPETCLETWDMYCRSNPAPETEAGMLDYMGGEVNDQDVEVVESVQRGLHSLAYNQGRLIVDDSHPEISEASVHHWQSLVLRFLGEEVGR